MDTSHSSTFAVADRDVGSSVSSPRRGTLLGLLLATSALIALAPSPAFAQAPTGTLQGLGFLNLGAPASQANGVSSDGAVVIGWSRPAANQFEAFRWTGGVMTGLGFIGGGGSNPYSFAFGVNADGTVVVGQSTNAANRAEAFRWTGGVMTGLGFIGGGGSFPGSTARGVSADGSVIVGQSSNAANQTEAFRWRVGVMTGLGFLNNVYTLSSANAVSADGSVVVGESRNAVNQTEAFRWTGGVMTGLGFIGGGAWASSNAWSVSADGSVVVGQTTNAAGRTEAFRWTGGVMTGLGLIGGTGPFTSSIAWGVSANGSVVVGESSNAANAIEAFRWTSATQIQSLAGLLTGAGVNLGGWTLQNARAISGNGQFIVGNGTDPQGRPQAYLVRYVDATVAPPPVVLPPVVPPPVVVPPVVVPPVVPFGGLTTVASLQGSVDGLSRARFGQMAALHRFAAPMLGENQAVCAGCGGSNFGGFGSLGSASAGLAGRHDFSGGLQIMGGAAFVLSSNGGLRQEDAALLALSARYVLDVGGAFRPFAQVGGWYAPSSSYTFRRFYMNGVGTAEGVGRARGDQIYVFGRLGTAIEIARRTELALSGEVGRSTFRTGGYVEPMSATNPFEAVVSAGSDQMTLAKARAQVTHGLTDRLEVAAWLAGVWSFDARSNIAAAIAGAGVLTPRVTNAAWAEYGLRVGYRVTDLVSIDAFINGTQGLARGGGRGYQLGGGARVAF